MKKIKEVSKIAGVSIRTLQYYDKEGLTNLQRTKDNHRLYYQKDLEQIWKILIYKQMDFQIKQIKKILSLPQTQQKTYLNKRKEEIKKNIKKLEENVKIINWIEKNDIPKLPNNNLSTSYKDYIKQLKNKILKELEEK